MEKELQNKRYRIRKLTPRECFRLMDVCESDIDKIQASGVSESQQYKMAGNSIVISVMAGIFKNLYSTNQEEQEGQLTLF
jgi:DNA (cytosine-5)-methyltransferase 1